MISGRIGMRICVYDWNQTYMLYVLIIVDMMSMCFWLSDYFIGDIQLL